MAIQSFLSCLSHDLQKISKLRSKCSTQEVLISHLRRSKDLKLFRPLFVTVSHPTSVFFGVYHFYKVSLVLRLMLIIFYVARVILAGRYISKFKSVVHSFFNFFIYAAAILCVRLLFFFSLILCFVFVFLSLYICYHCGEESDLSGSGFIRTFLIVFPLDFFCIYSFLWFICYSLRSIDIWHSWKYFWSCHLTLLQCGSSRVFGLSQKLKHSRIVKLQLSLVVNLATHIIKEITWPYNGKFQLVIIGRSNWIDFTFKDITVIALH